MKRIAGFLFIAFFLAMSIPGCTVKNASMTVNKDSIEPGGIVQRGSVQLQLIGKPLKVGQKLPDVTLTDALVMNEVSLSDLAGKVVMYSIVPSIDTKVCEEQTHYLGEEGDRLSENIMRVTISRDTPFAQKRFAEEAKLTDVQFLSDHRDAVFGKATGLLIDKNRLLARSVLVVDKEGIVRYMQVVPQLGELPDMEKAFEAAEGLAGQP